MSDTNFILAAVERLNLNQHQRTELSQSVLEPMFANIEERALKKYESGTQKDLVDRKLGQLYKEFSKLVEEAI